MKFYLDVTLLPDGDANLGFIWHKVFQQVHIGLADCKLPNGTSAIAVSIPGYRLPTSKDKSFPLGNKLRLLAETEETLKSFEIGKWLERLSDYCHVRSIQPVPSNVQTFARFARKNVVSPKKKAEKRSKHLNEPLEKTVSFMLKEGQLNECKLPYVSLESQSQSAELTGAKHRFRLFIERSMHELPIAGSFDCYGLSKTATVPWFE